MKEDKRNDIALFRYSVLAPLITGTFDTNTSARAFFRYAASLVYTNPDGNSVKVNEYTMQRWYYTYKKKGFEGLKPQRRVDCGGFRKVDGEIIKYIEYYKKEYPRIPATLIYDKLLDTGVIVKEDISLSTINRCVNKINKENKYTTNKDRKRYEREHINEVWCGDSSVGPRITLDGQKKKTYLIALVDDASRMVVGIDIFLNDNFINLMSVMKSAVRMYGKPKVFNFDNGSPYKNKQMRLLAARLGTTLNYCAPYTPTSKAKIERWFRTLKDHWMASLNMQDYKTLEELKGSLLRYVQTYNQSVHGSLQGLSPQDRFFKESQMILWIRDDLIDTSFLLELERRVSVDNVVMIDNEEYEVDYRFSGQRIKLRYAPDLSTIYVVDSTGKLEEIKLLNKHDNANIKRVKIKYTGGSEE